MLSFSSTWRSAAIALACVAACLAQTASGPPFGAIVSIGATPSDLVLDEARKRVYLVNTAANRIEIYDYETKAMAGTVGVGTAPISAALSMDGALLYVTNRDSSSLSVIDVDRRGLRETVSLPASPEGVAVGADGRVLITTQGTGQNNSLNTLLLYDRNQSFGQQIISLPTPQPLSTPSQLGQIFVGRPQVPFPGRMVRTPDGQFIIGMVAVNQTTNNAQTTLFVYEAASGVVLNSRRVTGQSSVLAVSPDGSKFMAGSTLYDTATLAVTAQMNTANLPFFITVQMANNTVFGSNPSFSIQANYGGSSFSPDGQTVYSAFNTSGTNQRPVANVLYVANSTNLGVRLGIRLPQSILGKMVATSDGQHLFAASESGIVYLPISKLYDYPIVQPETTQVFMAIDDCNKGLAKAQVKVSNLGSGRATYAVPSVTTALVAEVTTGVAPSTITFTMEPGRTGLVRQPGTNLFTGGSGTPFSVILLSNEAINIPNVIRVYMNYRQSDQRGIIHPVPTSLNNAQGLQELLLDEARGRVYITNAGYNRLEVFDIQRNRFLPPLDVGQLPKSMAMSLDRSLLYIGNTGGESISIVDLDALIVTGKVDFPPIPRSGTVASIQPSALAMGLSGLQFMMSNGSFWRVVGNEATVRAPSSIMTTNTITSPQYMIATPGGENILTLAGNGTAYLYDALSDTYTTSRQLYDQTPTSYFGPLAAAEKGAYYVVSGMTVNSALALIGGSERPGQTTVQPPQQQGQPPIQVVVSAGLRNVAMAYPLDDTRFVRLTTPVRQNATTATRDDARSTFELVDTRTGAESVVAVAPENPVVSVFGSTRQNVPSKQMALDSKGTVYAITLSGLSVLRLSIDGTPERPVVTSGARGIVNSNDGTPNYRPGSFITISGANLADSATADSLPLPTLLGGTCVTFNDIALPLMQTAPGQISAVIPPEVRSGQNVVQVRSLARAQSSEPLVVTVQRTLE